MDLAYSAIGFMTVVFIFQLIILWYMWWIYSQMIDNYDDVDDIIIDIYTLEVAESKRNGDDVNMTIPKRIRNRIAKRQAVKA